MTLVNFGNSLEKNNTKEEQEDDVAIGIDLGTTNSLVAYCTKDGKKGFVDFEGSCLLPSVVYYGKQDIKVGKKALSEENTANKVSSSKRILGKNLEEAKKILPFLNYHNSEDNNKVSFNVNGRNITALNVASDILLHLKKQAQTQLKSNISKAVITVPAYFDDNARNLTKQAAELAGLKVLRLINEPTAAALAYGLDENMKGSYIIYDFGGGTFDCTILSMQKGIFKVLATAGDVTLGGDDIDNALIDYILKNKINDTKVDFNSSLHSYLSTYVKDIKQRIYKEQQIDLKLEIEGKKTAFSISLQEFEEVIKPIINKTFKIVNNALLDSGLSKKDLIGLVLVGGSSKINMVKQIAKENYCENIYDNLNPQECVALGAGEQCASLLKLKKGNLLLDVVPLSLGVELAGGVVEKIIPRNSSTPIKKAQVFTTYKDGQTKLKIHVLQGERELVKDCRSLAQFTLSGIPKMVASMARIEVAFQVDADGILTVSAKEQSTGVAQEIEIKPTWGISLDQMKQMVFDSLANGAKDMQERLLALAKVEARRVLDATYSALQKDSHLIKESDVKDIVKVCNELEDLVKKESREDIEFALERLKKATDELAEKRMNNAIHDAIAGKKVDDIAK